MAIVKFIASGCPMNNIFPYVMNGEKTDDGALVSGIGCSPESALEEFRFVKTKFGKNDGRQYYHIVQSFSPDDKLTPETAHEIGLRFAGYFPGYQIVVATHCDRDHLHKLFYKGLSVYGTKPTIKSRLSRLQEEYSGKRKAERKNLWNDL